MPSGDLFPQSEAVCAYTAGIIDGEGCIRLQPKTYGLDISVGNTSLDLLVWLKDHWGGKIYANRSTSERRHAKPFYHWRLFSALAYPMLRRILPYMVIKTKRAEKALELEALYGKKNNYIPGYNEKLRMKRKQIYEDLKQMNTRGIH